ncbi:MAG: lytic transglycosylase domain-containing protein [Spirochaetales bacterium]|nr:lytic transglycosylase domain-containing protein [Spirochaetales bacterium]
MIAGFSSFSNSYSFPNVDSFERRLSSRFENFERFLDSPGAVLSQMARILRPSAPAPAPVAEKKASDPQNVSKAGLEALAQKTAAKYGVNASLVNSVINAESGFDPKAVSKAGAQGLMQLMPTTAQELGVTNPLDPVQNVDGGVRYLRDMLDRYSHNVPMALAAYNAGPGAVDHAKGIPDFPETQEYVQKVLSHLGSY